MVKVPLNGFHNTVFERSFGITTEIVLDFIRSYAISPIVTLAILDVDYEVLGNRVIIHGPTGYFDDGADNEVVRTLVMAADVVNLANLPVM